MKKLITFLLLVNFYLLTNAQSNQYLHFDGVDDYVSVVNLASEINGATQLSMTGWFNSDELRYGAGMMGFRGGGNGDHFYLLQLDNGKIECRLVISGQMFEYVAPAGTIQAGVWQHFAWIYDGSSVKLYLNGNLLGSHSANGTFSLVDKPFGIGKSIAPGYNFVFKGKIDEVSLWKTALTQVEIQDIMANEISGNENGLVVYYKFNQGIPGDDNTFIEELFTETANNINGKLHNFALTGTTSNFGGTLEPGFQVINFPRIPNKVISDPPFTLNAYTSSGLPVTYTLVSGPATLSGNTVTLTGNPGQVIIKASQPGDATYNPAEDVYQDFDVYDPNTILVQVSMTHPTFTDVYMPQLTAIPIAMKATIDHDDIFSITSVTININGNNVVLTNHDGKHYTGWWTPTSYGVQNVTIEGTNNYGATNTITGTFNIVNTASNITVPAVVDVLLDVNHYTEEVTAVLPSFVGGYDNLSATLYIDCPPGGCDPWDRVSHVEVQGHDGKWHEIIRYITPYGRACQHNIDLTDFISLLQGEVKFRFTLGTQGNGFLYSLDLSYNVGTPDYIYSTVTTLWKDTYQFGDLANLQPTEHLTINYDNNVEAARIKLVSTGHGWGQNNTGNAAEFHHDTHSIWVDGVNTFTQDNWLDCNPNPDSCQPQYGTWYYDRAGWCPGAIAPWFDFDLASIDVNNPMAFDYQFDPDYVDYCHPNNPNCVSGQTCPNCNAGFNPHLIVSSHLICHSDSPMNDTQVVFTPNSIDPELELNNISIYPNPNFGRFFIETQGAEIDKMIIYRIDGTLIKEIEDIVSGKETYFIDISSVKPGIYFVKLSNGDYKTIKKFIKK